MGEWLKTYFVWVPIDLKSFEKVAKSIQLYILNPEVWTSVIHSIL